MKEKSNIYYKLYGATEDGWQYIKRIYFQYEIDEEIEKLNKNVYLKVMIIEHNIDLDQDSVLFQKKLKRSIIRRKVK